MDYATLLLLTQDSSHQADVADTALRIASDANAHLTALRVHVPSYQAYVAAGTYPVAPSAEAIEHEKLEAAQHADRLKTAFVEQAHRVEFQNFEWRYHAGEMADGSVADIAALHARYADLVILGQHDPQERDSQISADTPAVIATASARPVLILPYGRCPDTLGQHIVLAWNATREATHAITAALPFLKRAALVEILIVDEGEARTHRIYGDEPGADIALFAARHGIRVSVTQLDGRGLSVAEVLLSKIADSGADLLVMGAYGHSRLRELVFGGVTYELMRHMTVPTLIAS
ncbi:universal stress protein [Salinisphaera sp. Q1T1-3]|uniref:universal stress protein n=1 Tax=Salinisphaera sp. Q1T1-3 TaxID=2321229 RepID=UPI000E70883E|nr:universal stress protein [Salinisphaera sp. Q1T1-3]RJS93687.1 universal stress protein [Salinisphaera sp. Q1T1-3]